MKSSVLIIKKDGKTPAEAKFFETASAGLAAFREEQGENQSVELWSSTRGRVKKKGLKHKSKINPKAFEDSFTKKPKAEKPEPKQKLKK